MITWHCHRGVCRNTTQHSKCPSVILQVNTIQSGPKYVRTRSFTTRDCRFNAFKFYLFILLMTSHDVTCMSGFVLFNNIIIFVVSFGKTAKLLLSIMIWVEETKDSLILVMSLHKDKI